jgi:hypothetical protein
LGFLKKLQKSLDLLGLGLDAFFLLFKLLGGVAFVAHDCGLGLELFELFLEGFEPLQLLFYLFILFSLLFGLILKLFYNHQKLLNLLFGLFNMLIFFPIDLINFDF